MRLCRRPASLPDVEQQQSTGHMHFWAAAEYMTMMHKDVMGSAAQPLT